MGKDITMNRGSASAMSRRELLGTGMGVAVRAGVRPNILFLSTDQQSASTLSCCGNRYLHTPAMDSLAASGVRFRNSFASYPRCSASRSTWFTGRPPHETRVVDNDQPIAAGMPTMGGIFRAAGYHTFYGGKWHLPTLFEEPPGFTRIFGGAKLGKDMDAGLADACVDFLRGRPREPFLLCAAFMNPHDICKWIRENQGTRQHADANTYPPAPGNLAIAPDEPEYMQIHRRNQSGSKPGETGIAARWLRDDFRFYLHSYYRMVESVDREIGRVLTALRSTGLDRNTLVILTADHGEGMGAHGWVEKGAFWEEVIGVPLIIFAPDVVSRGATHSSVVSGYDLLPTMCDYAGIPVPEKVRGISLRSAVQGKGLARKCVIAELFYKANRKTEGRMVRTERFKYIAFNAGARPEQLFDLERDPGENFNLAANAGLRDVLRSHRLMLREWIESTDDDFVPPAAAAG